MPTRRPVVLLACLLVLVGCANGGSIATGTSAATSAAPTPPGSSLHPSPPTPSPRLSPDINAVAWVVYQSPDGLQLTDPGTGSVRRALFDGPADALHADWSPDGGKLAFAVDAADGTRDIWTSAWDGADAARLIDCRAPCRDADGAAWSPDGTRIAFTSIDSVDGHNRNSALQIVDVSTREVTTLATTSGPEYVAAARWSPDGRAIVVQIDRYVDDRNDTTALTGQSIGVVDLDDATPSVRVIRGFDTFSTYPDWHPSDHRILFAAGARDPLDPTDRPSNLYTIGADGTGLAQLTHLGPDDDGIWMPAFEPDGSGILATLVHRPDGSLTLVSLEIDGTAIADLDPHGPIYGAHSRRRPLPPET